MSNFLNGDLMKTALITGGTSGIGLAAAKIFTDNNFNCIIAGRSQLKAQAALEHLKSADNRVFFIPADVSKVEDCDKLVNKTIAKFGRLDILINSAGVYSEGEIESVNESQFYKIIDVNIKGTFFMCRAAAPELKKYKGSIVNIASDAGIKGNYFCALYSASKGAVVAFTKSLALEFANIPVRVNCVAPGDVWTPMTQEQLKNSSETVETLKSVYPMQRIATAEEVAESIYFLSSEKASFITGAVLSVDGGLTA